MRLTLVISLLLAVLAVLFALQNPEQMSVEFGPFDVTSSTALILIITFAIGALVGLLAMVPSRLKQRKEVKTLKKRIVEREAETPIPPMEPMEPVRPAPPSAPPPSTPPSTPPPPLDDNMKL